VLPLLPTEKEKLVLDNGSADAVAEIIKAQGRPHRSKERTRVELVVSDELKTTPVIFIATATGNQANLSTGVAAILSRKICGLNLHFLDEINSEFVDLACIAA